MTKPTVEELQGTIEAMKAGPDIEIQFTAFGTENWDSPRPRTCEASFPRRGVEFLSTNTCKYRIKPTKPTPTLRPYTQEEWETYVTGPFGGWVRLKESGVMRQVLAIGQGVMVYGARSAYDMIFMLDNYTAPDKSPLGKEEVSN